MSFIQGQIEQVSQGPASLYLLRITRYHGLISGQWTTTEAFKDIPSAMDALLTSRRGANCVSYTDSNGKTHQTLGAFLTAAKEASGARVPKRAGGGAPAAAPIDA